jgi:hypothetical protein
MIQVIYPTIKINHMILISTNNLLTEFQVMSINLKKDLLNISMQLLLPEFFQEELIEKFEERTGGYDFERDEGLKLLFKIENLVINSQWWRKDLGNSAKDMWYIGILANDFFVLCCAEAVEVTPEDLEELLVFYLADPKYGIDIWMCKKEKMKPTHKFIKCLKYTTLPVKEILPFIDFEEVK